MSKKDVATTLEHADPVTGELETISQTSLAVSLSKAEVDQQISTALAYPRDERKGGLRGIVNRIVSLAILSDEAAKESIYALPRGGKAIKGPSVRLAEIVASQWGNCRVGARVVHVDRFEKYVEAEGVFHDLETNTSITSRVRRRIVDSKGRLYNDDMILVTGNAAAAIAKRNAIFGGVPKAVWNEGYMAADAVVAGDITTLAQNRDEAIKSFAIWGIKPEQIFAALEVESLDDVGLDHISTMRSMYKQIKDGEQKVEDYFPPKVDGAKAVEAAKGTAAKLNKIADDNKDTGPAASSSSEKAAGKGGSAAESPGNAEPPKEEVKKAEAKTPARKWTGEDAYEAGQAHAQAGNLLRGMPIHFREDNMLKARFEEGFNEVSRQGEDETPNADERGNEGDDNGEGDGQ